MHYMIVILYSVISILLSWYFYRSLFAPAVWLQSLWTFFIILSVIVAYYFFELPDLSGIYTVLVINTAFMFGCFMSSLIIKTQLKTVNIPKITLSRPFSCYRQKIVIDNKYVVNEKFVNWFMVIIILLSCVGIVLQLNESGVNLLSMSIADIQSLMTNLRYAEQYNPPAYQRFLSYFAYIGVFVASLVFPFANSIRTKLLCISPLVILIFKSTLFTARFGTLASFLLFLSGYIATNVFIHKGNLNVFKYVFYCVVGFVFLLSFSFFVQISRPGSDQIDAAINLSRTMSLLSPLIGFLSWFTKYDANESLKFGGRTFEGLYDLLGINVREIGQYSDTVGLENLETSNIYSVYRGLIEDFSVGGTVILYLIFGLIIQYIYIQTARGKLKLTPLLAVFYVYVPISFVISIFSHNSLLFSIIIGSYLWQFVFLKENSKTKNDLIAHYPNS